MTTWKGILPQISCNYLVDDISPYDNFHDYYLIQVRKTEPVMKDRIAVFDLWQNILIKLPSLIEYAPQKVLIALIQIQSHQAKKCFIY